MWRDVIGAFSFLTVLPVYVDPGGRAPGKIFAYFPAVGWAIGAILAAIYSIHGIDPDVRAFGLVVVWVVLTGGLHLDGFGDSCDGLFVTAAPARRLEIMKDSRAGSWAVIGLVLLLSGKWIMLRHADSALLLMLPPVIARWMMMFAAFRFPYARSDGIGGYFRHGLGWGEVGVATVLTVPGLLIDARIWGMMVALSFVSGLGVGIWASRRLGGGLTGDIYGFIGEFTELLCLLILVILI